MKATVAPTKEFRPPSVSWVRRNSCSSPTKQQNHDENSPSSKLPTNTQSHEAPLNLFPIKDLKSMDPTTNAHQPESTPVKHVNNIRSARYSSQSIRPKKNTDEKEQDNLSIRTSVMTPINQPKVTWVKRDSTETRNRSARITVDRKISSRLERLHGEEFTPLNSLNNDRHSNISRTMTSNFRRSDSITNIDETQQKNRR
jgi:hypothetical protein